MNKMKTNKISNLGTMALLIVGIVVISGCIGGPSPDIVSVEGHAKFQGLNVVTEVNVLVDNNGDAGEVLVEAQYISKKGRTYSDRKTIYMDAGETKYVNFIFDTTWDESGVCKATARAK